MNDNVSLIRNPMMIPTYVTGKAELNPIFYETRINQGTKGNIYPLPLTDKLTDEIVNKEYDAIHLENQYIKLTVLPELGGKIYSAQDKTNGYDFIYRNNVIKPALIGLCGPWVSGGIEFNWPQHHRPTTFMPVDCTLEENEDGSKTVWVGEVEPLYRTKGMVGITLYPGKSYIQAKVRLYNRTPFPQSFLWWANLAVHANDSYKAVFPTDIDYITFHAKTEVTSFPIVKGKFVGIDYGEGTDISMYKNVPGSSSFFIFNSNYSFMGGYDLAKDAGVVHFADNQISTGKKIFTWGTTEFAKRWCENLTDNDGSYIEIMTGVYTDNQPDFSWIQPYETKIFEQFWYPVKEIGIVKNANLDGAVSLEIEGSVARFGFYTTGVNKNAKALLTCKERILFEQVIDISPDKPFTMQTSIPESTSYEEVEVKLISSDCIEIISFKYRGKYHAEAPKAIPPAKRPEEISTSEELYINGLHIEQYKHPTIDPEPYYMEALRRDPRDYRCNNAMGLINMKRGRFMEAEVYFKKAVEALTLRNPNPYDGEAHYNLGLVQRFLGKNEEAYKSFYKATWNYAWKSAGYQAIAEIHCSKGELSTALKHINNCLLTNSENLIGRNLKTAILRKLGRLKEAEKLSMETSNMDKLDFWSRYELSLMRNLQGRSSEGEDLLAELKFLMRDKPEAYLDIAIEYGYAGLYDDAIGLLDTLAKNMGSDTKVYPMVYYYMGYYSLKQGEDSNGLRYFKLAENSIIDYCFSCRLESISVLKTAQKLNPQGSHAFYLLGNLYYDKRRYDEAIENWENSRKLNDTFSIVHRNLALAYFEKKKDVDAAVKSMEKAFECKNKDSRLLFELFQLYKNVNKSIEKILVLLEQHDDLVEERDDLYIGRIAFYNQLGRYDDALRLLKKRHFHPYEGGEGILTRQHTFAYLMRGREFMKKKKYAEAISEFNQAFTFPKSYGEGKRYGLPECEVNYYLGCAYEASGNIEEASKHYKQAAEEIGLFKEMDYYRSLAMIKLGNEKEARKIFEQLIKYAVSELEKEGKLGYTTNMPTVLPFEKDISIRHEIQNRYILGLGYLGLGRKIEASVEFRKVLELDINHSQSKLRLTEIES